MKTILCRPSLAIVIAILAVASGCGQNAPINARANTGQSQAEKVTPDSTLDYCAEVKASVSDAGFDDTVKVHCDDDYAFLTSNVYPSHDKMNGIVATNEQTPVPAAGYSAPVSLKPIVSDEPKTRDSSIAVAVNGVPIFDYSSGGDLSMHDLTHHQSDVDTVLNQELDNCGGHAGRGDDYHYHERPSCMIEQMDNAGDDAIIGWGFDGFPIYGDNNPDGTPIERGALDVCNGQADPKFGYRYHTSVRPPYIIQCLMGESVNFDSLPRVGINRPSGIPPENGVENFTFTEHDDGLRTLTYDYRGESYYINYTPTDTQNCYDFEYKTITNNGRVESGEYCSQAHSGGGRRGGGMGGMGDRR